MINNETPLWKQLGYPSEEAYKKATGENPLQNYAQAPAPAPVTPDKNTITSAGLSSGISGTGTGNTPVGNDKAETVDVLNSGNAVSVATGGNAGGGSVPSVPSSPSEPEAPKIEASESPAAEPTYSYSGEANFLEWYKRNFGIDYDPSVGLVRPEGMNDGVWNAANALYTAYMQSLADEEARKNALANLEKYYTGQMQLVTDNYGAAQESLDKSKRKSQEAASIMYDKLKKYLPAEVRAQGLGGLGVSESAMLEAQNTYMNRMGDIESGYQDDKSTLEANKTNAISELDKYNMEASTAINDKYDVYARDLIDKGQDAAADALQKYEDILREDQSNAFDAAWVTISESGIYDSAEMATLLESFKGTVSDEQYAQLLARGNATVSANLKAKEEEEAAEKENDEDQAEIELKNEQDGIYQQVSLQAQTMLESFIANSADGKMSDAEFRQAQNYVNSNLAGMGESNARLMNAIINGYKYYIRSESEQTTVDNEQATEDAANAAKTPVVNKDITLDDNLNEANSGDGDNFKIKIGNTTYYVEKGYDASDALNKKLSNAYKESTGSLPAEGAFMIYDGRIYLHIENNDSKTTCWSVVQQRANSYIENFDYLCKALRLITYKRNYKDDETE